MFELSSLGDRHLQDCVYACWHIEEAVCSLILYETSSYILPVTCLPPKKSTTLRLLKTKGKCCSGKMVLSSQLSSTIPMGITHYQTILARFESLGQYSSCHCVFQAWISTCVLIFFVGELRDWEYTYKSFFIFETCPSLVFHEKSRIYMMHTDVQPTRN